VQPCRRPDLIIGLDVRASGCDSTELAQVVSSGAAAVCTAAAVDFSPQAPQRHSSSCHVHLAVGRVDSTNRANSALTWAWPHAPREPTWSCRSAR